MIHSETCTDDLLHAPKDSLSQVLSYDETG